MESRCDFKTLLYDKDAILNRVRSEIAEIDKAKKLVLESTDSDLQLGLMVDVVDKMKGIDIMSQRLIADFGMTFEQIKKEAPSEPFSWMDKIRLGMALKNAQNRERGRK